jgi:hypothetical protein
MEGLLQIRPSSYSFIVELGRDGGGGQALRGKKYVRGEGDSRGRVDDEVTVRRESEGGAMLARLSAIVLRTVRADVAVCAACPLGIRTGRAAFVLAVVVSGHICRRRTSGSAVVNISPMVGRVRPGGEVVLRCCRSRAIALGVVLALSSSVPSGTMLVELEAWRRRARGLGCRLRDL